MGLAEQAPAQLSLLPWEPSEKNCSVLANLVVGRLEKKNNKTKSLWVTFQFSAKSPEGFMLPLADNGFRITSGLWSGARP